LLCDGQPTHLGADATCGPLSMPLLTFARVGDAAARAPRVPDAR
jgi:hypothetical protein